MLTTSKEPRFSYVRRIMALPLLVCVVLLFAFRLQKDNNETISTVKPGIAFKLVVDAGHGGTDNGALGINGQKEKDLTLAISKKIKELSTEYGIEVVLTRDNDVFMAPPEKVAFSEKQNADAFISIHTNAASTKEKAIKSGVEIFVSPDNTHLNESKILGSAVLQKLGADFKINTPLLMRQVGIWVLKANPDPAILIECGYITNKEDLAILKDDAQVETMARKILEGVAAYANNSNSPIDPYEVKLQDDNAFADTTNPKDNKQTTIKINGKSMNAAELPADVLYVVNGELKNKSDINKLKPENIKNIDVLKGESAAKLYGDKGKNGVVVITTKDYNPKTSIVFKTPGDNPPVYVVDGNFMTSQEVQVSISPDDILSVNVLKGEDAIKTYGDKGKNGVIEMTTKNKKDDEGAATFFAPPVIQKDDDGTATFFAPPVIIKDDDENLKQVQQMPSFPGGQGALNEYVSPSIVNTLKKKGGPPGTYSVIVSFKVSESGKVSEIKALNDPGYGAASEVVKMIKEGPDWIPAKLNGKNIDAVISQKISILFKES